MHYQLTIKDLEYRSFYLCSIGSSSTKDPHPLVILMTSCNSNKAPSLLSSCKTYDDWCKTVRVWTKFTDLPPEKQGVALFLLLNGEASDAALDLEEEVISGKEEVKSIMACLIKFRKRVTLYLSFMPWNLLKHINDLILCLYQNALMNLKNASTRLKIMKQRCQTIS